MTGYVLKRLASIVALAFGITVLVFLIIHFIPGDPVTAMLGTSAADPALIARLNAQLGLDRSLPTQYLLWLGNVLHGDFGYSYVQQQSVASLVGDNMPATVQLTLASLSLSLLLGSTVGVIAAVRRNGVADTAAMSVALAFMSIPSFWLGLLLILLFAVQLPWFDVVGGPSLKGLVLPAVTLALGTAGFNARFVRSSVLQALTYRHVITARAKGLSGRRVFRRHVLRNALLPVLTVVGLQLGQLLSGAVVVETVFSRPGVGRLLVQAILAKDYLTVQAVVLIIALAYAFCNLAVDLLYPVIDPRVGRR
jgi:ABC-type dipeptide/oligopeptide/nickel transport system permease component